MPSQLEARLRKHLQTHDGKADLLFINRRGRPYSANKLRAKVLHLLLVKLGIPRGGFHATRHGATSALLADGATPAVVQKQLRHSDPRITLGVYGLPAAPDTALLGRHVSGATVGPILLTFD